MVTIILKGNPLSTNSLYRSSCRGKFPTMYMTDQGKEKKELYHWLAKSQWKGKPLKTTVILTVRLYFGNKSKHDIDNYNKILFDALTGVIWENDSQIVDLTIQKYYDKANPRIEVDIYDTCLPE